MNGKSPMQDEVERVARAICAARGEDPDAPRETGGVEPREEIGENGAIAVMMAPVVGRSWQKYIYQAREFIASYRAISNY